MAKFIYSEIKSETSETGVESPGHKPVPASTFSLHPTLSINNFPQPQIFNRRSSPFTSADLHCDTGGFPTSRIYKMLHSYSINTGREPTPPPAYVLAWPRFAQPAQGL